VRDDEEHRKGRGRAAEEVAGPRNYLTKPFNMEGEIELTAREYELLESMVRNHRQVLSRDLLLSRVWEQEFGVETNVVDVYIGYLRRKVDAPGETKLIRTVRGAGYSLREG
jgi:DNA-binding response OmpR family regulator